MKQQEDELFACDAQGVRVNGRFDANGWFIVDASERSVKGRCDSEGYLLDFRGIRVFVQAMKERLTKRKQLIQGKSDKPKADEFFCYDSRGEKITGKYNEQGQFIADPVYRKAGKCDKDGFLLDASGKKVVNNKIRDRIKKRNLQNK